MPGVGDTAPLLVRVIAGSLGGRRLAAPPGRDTRPTSDRVREAMFMALEPLAGRRVMDLFAGSGALGIEALSRGAARAAFVDSDGTARRVLKANLESLDLAARATVSAEVLPDGLRRLTAELAACDLIVLDPPYQGTLAIETLESLDAVGVLRAGVTVVVEHHGKRDLPERVGRLARRRTRRFGETVITTYDVADGDDRAEGSSDAGRDAEERL